MARKKKQPYNPNDSYIVNWHCKVCKKKGIVGHCGNMSLIRAIKAAFNRHKNCIEPGIRYSYIRKVQNEQT